MQDSLRKKGFVNCGVTAAMPSYVQAVKAYLRTNRGKEVRTDACRYFDDLDPDNKSDQPFINVLNKVRPLVASLCLALLTSCNLCSTPV